MKRIYLLVLLTVGTVASVFAQRHPNLQIRHLYAKSPGTPVLIQDGDHIIADGGGGTSTQISYNFSWRIVNHGTSATDTVQATDSIKIKSPWGVLYTGIISGGLGQNDSATLSPSGGAVTITPTTQITSSQAKNTTWCDSVYMFSGPSSTTPATETDMSNNKTCNNIVVDFWLTGVQNVDIDGSGIIIFPNPTTGKLNFKYNFGNNTDASVAIVDVIGKTVYQKELKNMSGVQNVPVDMTNFTPGMYILKVNANNTISTEKFYIK